MIIGDRMMYNIPSSFAHITLQACVSLASAVASFVGMGRYLDGARDLYRVT